jgi:hypothetical protein
MLRSRREKSGVHVHSHRVVAIARGTGIDHARATKQGDPSMKLRGCFHVLLATITLSACAAFDEDEPSTDIAAEQLFTPCARDSVRVPVDAINYRYDRNGNGFVCRDVLGKRVRWHDDRE